MTKKAPPLKRRISDWLEATAHSRVSVGIPPAAAVRRARHLRREIVEGKVGPRDVTIDEDLKSVLHALVSIAVASRGTRRTLTEVAEITEFLDRLEWGRDIFGEKADLIRQLHLWQARIELIVGGRPGRDDDAALGPEDPFRRRRKPTEADAFLDPLVLDQEVDPEREALKRETIEVAFGAPRTNVEEWLSHLDLGRKLVRDALLGALREAGTEIYRDPISLIHFVQAMLIRFERSGETSRAEPGSSVPVTLLYGHAERLAGLAYITIGNPGKAASYLTNAYRNISRARGSLFDLALVEMVEAQRRYFLGRGREALTLSSRVVRAFESLGLKDYVARGWEARGLALAALGRWEDAVREHRRAVPVFESGKLWSNYIGAVNSLGLALTRLGRFDEARSAYARALRRLSGEENSLWLPFVRHGLGELLFYSGRYRDAARTFREVAEAIRRLSFGYFYLKWRLQEIESWVRAGELTRARETLDTLLEEAGRMKALDRVDSRRLRNAVSGKNPQFERLAKLREQVLREFGDRAALPLG